MKNRSIIFAVIFCIFALTSCNSDDEIKQMPLEEYIIGKWQSYRAEVFTLNEKNELAVEKTGRNSQLFVELNFKDNSNVIGYSWEQDQSGTSSWTRSSGTYWLSGYNVHVSFDKESISLVFNEKENNMYMRVSIDDETYGTITSFVYLRKV